MVDTMAVVSSSCLNGNMNLGEGVVDFPADGISGPVEFMEAILLFFLFLLIDKVGRVSR
jgi:hypothetical protein